MRSKKNDIKCRTLEEARYFIDNHCTVREAAKAFGISKSTVFVDLSKRLPHYSHPLSVQVNSILSQNKAERAIRGGIAKAEKYKSKKS